MAIIFAGHLGGPAHLEEGAKGIHVVPYENFKTFWLHIWSAALRIYPSAENLFPFNLLILSGSSRSILRNYAEFLFEELDRVLHFILISHDVMNHVIRGDAGSPFIGIQYTNQRWRGPKVSLPTCCRQGFRMIMPFEEHRPLQVSDQFLYVRPKRPYAHPK